MPLLITFSLSPKSHKFKKKIFKLMELKRMETREDYNPPIKVVNSFLIIKSLFLREMLPQVKTS